MTNDDGRGPTEDPAFGLVGEDVFLNHASVSPPCRAARRAVHEAADGIAADDDYLVASSQTSRHAREAFAGLVRGRVDRVQCFQNTSSALSSVAFGLRWKRGDEVLVSRNEFVSNYLVWKLQQSKGVTVRHLPTVDEWVDPGELERVITDKTRVVAVSAVHWATGARQDLHALADIAHDHGAFLIVDAAQSLGAVVHSMKRDGYDVLATNTYKWLLSYNGTAFAEFSPEIVGALDPAAFGWLAVDGDPEPEIRRDGSPEFRIADGVGRLLGGAPSALSNVAAIAAFKALETVGLDRVEREVRRNAGAVMTAADENAVPVVTPRGPDWYAGIVALRVPDADRYVPWFREQGIRLGARGGLLRVAPHFYTPRGELDAFGDALRTSARTLTASARGD